MNDHDDDPLVRALRAPGTPGELAGERDAVAAYRATFGAPRRSRRALGRLGLGGGAFVLSIALGGGVAAAYTRTLPDPVQDFAHSVLGPVGVPAAEPRERRPQPEIAAPAGPDTATAPPTPDPTTTTTDVPAEPGTTTPPTSPPTGNTSPRPGEATESAAPGGGPSPLPSPGQPSPTSPPTTDPTPPTAPPTAPPTTGPEPATPKPRAVSIAVSDATVDPGDTVVVSGTVTDAKGASVADREVRLAYRTAGGSWTVVATEQSSSTGSVSFTGPPVTENVATRLVVRRKVVSDKVRIEVEPSIELSAADERIDVSCVGGQAGDTVVLVRVTADGTKEVGRRVLSGSGTASFAIEPRSRRTVYVARLLRTPRHLSADDRLVVPRSAQGQRDVSGTPTSPT